MCSGKAIPEKTQIDSDVESEYDLVNLSKTLTKHSNLELAMNDNSVLGNRSASFLLESRSICSRELGLEPMTK